MAKRENLGEVDIPGIKKQPLDMQKVIIGLQQANNNRMSNIFAKILLSTLGEFTTVHKKTPQQAAFV